MRNNTALDFGEEDAILYISRLSSPVQVTAGLRPWAGEVYNAEMVFLR